MSVWTTRKLERDRTYIVMRHPLRGINNIINGIKFRDSYAVVEKDSKSYYHLKRMPVLRKAEEYPLTHLRSLNFICRTSDVKMVYGEDVYVNFLKAEEDAKLAKELAVKKAQEEAELAEEKRRLEELQKAEKIEQKIQSVKESTEDSNYPPVEGSINEVFENSFKDNSEEVIKFLEEEKPTIKKCSKTTKSGKLCKFDSLDYSPSGYCRLHLLEDPKLEHFGIEIPRIMTKQERKKMRRKINKKLQDMKKRGEF